MGEQWLQSKSPMNVGDGVLLSFDGTLFHQRTCESGRFKSSVAVVISVVSPGEGMAEVVNFAVLMTQHQFTSFDQRTFEGGSSKPR